MSRKKRESASPRPALPLAGVALRVVFIAD